MGMVAALACLIERASSHAHTSLLNRDLHRNPFSDACVRGTVGRRNDAIRRDLRCYALGVLERAIS